jgi:hypothetical protein
MGKTKSAEVSFGKFSASLYVGITTVSCTN